MITSLNADVLRNMFLGGAENLKKHKDMVNDLNVFPVPDGDTGTNMTLTIMSAAASVNEIQDLNMQSLAEAISHGSLRGARGNSGVILSQIFRGLSKVIKNYETIDTATLAIAFKKATETAYKAVMQPKEGTILTVIKAISDESMELAKKTEDIEKFLDEVHDCAKRTLDKTPDMLPVLKEAGVVDSGGMGLLIIIEGFIAILKGKELDTHVFEGISSKPRLSNNAVHTEADIKYGYCTEFIILLSDKVAKPRLLELQEYLEKMGDSIVLVPDDELIKIHVHTNQPGKVITKALTYGELSNLKIDNMREEHRELIIKNAPGSKKDETSGTNEATKKKVGFVTIAAGDGFRDLFKQIGVDVVIEGGQTMNPSTDDILNAVNKINANTVFVMPNNKNIILACEQAKSIIKDKEVIVIPTTTVPQGISAILSYVEVDDLNMVIDNMTEAMNSVATASLTYAVRDTKINNIPVYKDDFIGISDKELLSAGTNMMNVFKDMISKIAEDRELITIYYGDMVTKEEAEKALEIAEKYAKDKEVELAYGGQPIYYYIVSGE